MKVRGLPSLLGTTSRIGLMGEYLSPNVCFIEGDDDDADAGGGKGADDADADDAADDADDADAEDGDADEGADDADADGDDGADDGEGGRAAKVEDDDEKPRKRGASEVIRENKRRAQDAERKADEAIRRAEAAERRVEEAERRANERRQQETAEQEAARVELMSESERVAHYRQKDREEHQRDMNGMKFQMWDTADQTKFDRLVDRDPLVAKVADDVEKELRRLRSEGRPPVERAILADLLIGRMVRAERGKAKTKQTRRGEESVRRETTKPARTRSGAPASRQRRGQEDTAAARRRRLEDVRI